ncbi:hypothetical protein GOODEAATRI_025640 [Goodea atripinnis]|uniref:Uncharacterized protein n=1 Tax=Goodea atripinnis TaxID=208336 RepID=A0ABV0PHC8_9TELE
MLPSCHNVQRKITTRFIRLRLRIAAKHIFNERKKILANAGHLGSKSQAKNTKKKQCQTSSCTPISKPSANTLTITTEELGLSFANTPPPRAASAPVHMDDMFGGIFFVT